MLAPKLKLNKTKSFVKRRTKKRKYSIIQKRKSNNNKLSKFIIFQQIEKKEKKSLVENQINKNKRICNIKKVLVEL